MPGPPPKHPSQRIRRHLAPGLEPLPAEGRRGDLPEWPLAGKLREDEITLWYHLWRTPQAVKWEELGYTRMIARYTRLLIIAESGAAPAPILAEVRQMEDRLGLTPMSLMRLRWEIVPSESVGTSADDQSSTSPRARLRVVDPQAANDG